MVKSVRAKVAEKAENTPMPCYLQRYHLFPNRAQKLSLNDIRHIRLLEPKEYFIFVYKHFLQLP